MTELIRQFARSHRSERTATTYAATVASFLAFLRGRPAEPRDVEQFIQLPLRSGSAPSISTRNQALAAIRSFARFAVRDGVWSEDVTASLAFQREAEKDPAVLYVTEAWAFILAIEKVSPEYLRTRDRAMLGLLFTLGLRVSELVRLNISQIDVTSSLIISTKRKGGRVQDLPIAAEAARLLRRWIAERPRLAAPGDLALFVSRRGTRLTPRSVERLFERIRKHVGTAKHATPHTARHSFITIALARGADITVVSRLAGHASVATTMRYRHLLDTEPRRAVALLGAVIPAELRAQPRANDIEEMTTNGFGAETWPNNVRPANDSLDGEDDLDDVA